MVTTLMALTHINIKTKGLPMNTFRNDEATINAVVKAQGALALCIARVLTPEQREELAIGLAAVAGLAEKEGNTTLQTILLDMQKAIR